MKEPIRVLLIDSTPELEERLTAVLNETEHPPQLSIRRISARDIAAETAARSGVDVILLPLREPADGVSPVIELKAQVPDIPVVVLAESPEEALAIKAVHLGATDYLISDRLYGTLVERCLRHAVEIERVRGRLDELEAEWPPSLSSDRHGDAPAASLRTAVPKRFEELVQEYRRILDLAVEQTLYRVEHPIGQRLTELARHAGELWAGPRDVVEIHAAVMKEKEQREGPQRIRLIAGEGRMALLELMGRLVSYYRRANLERIRRRGS